MMSEKLTPPTAYREVKVGKTLYRVTNIFKGEVELSRVLEGLAVKKALRAAIQPLMA